MKRVLWLLLLAICVAFPAAQESDSGSLVMVRCDTGYGDKLLSSPDKMDLSALAQSFNPKVDTIIFIHGFNNSHSSAKESFGKSVGMLKPVLGDRNYVGFYWPSDLLVMFGTAVEHANKSAPFLMHVLSNINSWYGGSNRKIHLMSHSLGGRVLLSTLKLNDARYIKWGYCFSFAAAVHSDVYFTGFSGTNQPPLKTLVFHSKNDWVLKYLYSLYYWLFDSRGFEGTPEYSRWQAFSLEEKLQYMRELELSCDAGGKPRSEFDAALYSAIEDAEKQAMGLNGAKLGDPVSIGKVGNVDVSEVVEGHSYWDNRQIMDKVSAVLK